MIGMQALAAAGARLYSENLNADVRVTQWIRGANTEVAAFSVNKFNSLVHYSDRVEKARDLTVNAAGTGCVLFQVLYTIRCKIFSAVSLLKMPCFVELSHCPDNLVCDDISTREHLQAYSL